MEVRMTRLTKRRVLELCLELWTWLAENPRKAKYEWPGWNRVGKMVADCPCCEWVKRASLTCWACPLRDYWPADGPVATQHCLHPSSPFRRWQETWEYQKLAATTEAARTIAGYAKDALAKLPKRRVLPRKDEGGG